MEIAENKGFIYEFGKFVLDPQEKTLFVEGVPVHLPAKEFETLLLWVENNGKALTKEEMMQAIWRDAFVEETNPVKQISRMRKLFNTDKTVAKRVVFETTISIALQDLEPNRNGN